jgi:hypothetical protein
MKRSIRVLQGLVVVLYLSALPLFAQHGGGGGHAGGGMGHGAASSHGNPNTGDSGVGKSTGASSKELNNVVNNPDSKLGQKLSSLLPSGMTLQQAASGFKNLGQFVAALHVYHNLGLASKNPPVSFTDFANRVQTHSLGAAIKQFDPTANASSEAKKGTRQARDDIKENGTAS